VYIKVKSKWYEVNPPEWFAEARVDDLPDDFIDTQLDDPRRHDPIGDGSSPKGIGSRRATSDEKNVIAAFTRALKPGADRKAFDRNKTRWVREKVRIKSEFGGVVNKLATGDITKNQFINQSRKIFKQGYETAYRLGTNASGLEHLDELPKVDLKWLERARSHEYQYLDQFADDIVAQRGMMDYQSRSEMYVDSMDSMFEAGRVDGYPDEHTWVYWEINPAEHCGDCISLAIDSPYRPNELPTTPRAGDTMCLSNCQCNLRLRYEKPDQIELDVKPASRELAKALGMLATGTTAAVVRRQLQKAKELGVPEPEVDADDAVLVWPEDDEEAEAEAVERWGRVILDWNIIDDAVSALQELDTAKATVRGDHMVDVRMEKVEKFQESVEKLPHWINPLSPELRLWHRIGEEVLKQVRRGEDGRGKTD